MHRSLKELLLDDYLDLDNNDDDRDSISISQDNEQHIYSNIIHKEKSSKDYLREILYHPIYEYFMAIVVISSSITLGLSLETDEIYVKDTSRQRLIYAFDEILIGILVFEFLLKIYFESIHYWLNWANLYDFIIILSGFIEIIWNLFFQKLNTTITNLLKGFRLLQLIRLYRIIKLSRGLQVLTRALIKTVLTYTFSVGILVFLLIYIVAVAGQMLYGKPENSPWHHFPTSLVISLRLILVDNWNLLGPELEARGSPIISRWFFVIVVFIGNRIVTNVLVGLMIESVSSVNDDYIKEKREEKTLRNQKKREELSKRTVEILNTRFSDAHNHLNPTENTTEQIRTKLELIHNEIIRPKDLIFSLDWLEKLVTCSEKTHHEAKLTRHLLIHTIQSLTDIIQANLERTESEIEAIYLTKTNDKKNKQ